MPCTSFTLCICLYMIYNVCISLHLLLFVIMYCCIVCLHIELLHTHTSSWIQIWIRDPYFISHDMYIMNIFNAFSQSHIYCITIFAFAFWYIHVIISSHLHFCLWSCVALCCVCVCNWITSHIYNIWIQISIRDSYFISYICYVIVNIFNAFPPQKSDTFTNRRVNFTFMYSWCETFTLIHSVSRILCGIHKLQFALLCCVQWYISLSMCCVCFASSFAAATRCVICCFHIWNMFLVCFHHCFTHYWNLMEVNRGTQMLHYIYYFVYI